MNTDTIATNIRRLREARHWSQEELALVAGVDVRTIQRAEAGRPLAVETLKAFAAAFDTAIEALQVSEKELSATIHEFRIRFRIVEMRVLAGSAEVGNMIGGAGAFLLQRIGELTEEQLDGVAEFEETIRDYLDIWSELPATDRREAEKTLYQFVGSLNASRMSVSFGLEHVPLRATSGGPVHLAILHVAVTPGSTPMLALVRDKTIPIDFA